MRLLNYTKSGRPFWNMLTVASVHDSSHAAKLLVGVQVDVTEHPSEAQAAPVGMQAAGMVGRALQRLGWEGEADPWAGFSSQVEPVKPHKAEDPAWAALQAAAEVGGLPGPRVAAAVPLPTAAASLLSASRYPKPKADRCRASLAPACFPCPALLCAALLCRLRAASWRRPTSPTSRSWGQGMPAGWTWLSWRAAGTSLP